MQIKNREIARKKRWIKKKIKEFEKNKKQNNLKLKDENFRYFFHNKHCSTIKKMYGQIDFDYDEPAQLEYDPVNDHLQYEKDPEIKKSMLMKNKEQEISKDLFKKKIKKVKDNYSEKKYREYNSDTINKIFMSNILKINNKGGSLLFSSTKYNNPIINDYFIKTKPQKKWSIRWWIKWWKFN